MDNRFFGNFRNKFGDITIRKRSMRTILLFFLFVIGGMVSVHSQNQKVVDSLLKIYHSTDSIGLKIEVLDELSESYIYSDPNTAKSYIDSMALVSKRANSMQGKLRTEFAYGHYYSTIGQMDKGSKYYRKALKMSIDNSDDTYLATLLKNLAIYEEHKGNYKKAIDLMDSSATLQLQYGDYLRYGSAMNVIGFNYYELGNYPKAMEYYQNALRTMDTLEIKTYHKADTYRNMGDLLLKEEKIEESLALFEKALDVYKEIDDRLYQATTQLDIGEIYFEQKQFDSALSYYEKGLSIAKLNDFPTEEAAAYSALGLTYVAKGETKRGIEYLEKSGNEDLIDLATNNKITHYYNLGNALSLDGQVLKAKYYLDRAVFLADSTGILKKLRQALTLRSNHYSKYGEIQNAFNDLTLAQKIGDEIFSLERTKQVEKLRAIYETERKEAELAIQKEEINTLNERVKVDQLTKGLYASGMFTFIIFSGLLFFGFRQRIKRNRIEREKQEELLKKEIEHKQKELASQTLHLVQKNTFVQELLQNLEKIKKSPETFKMEFRRIVMLLKKENASDKDWEVFKSYFADVHNDFDQKLKTIHKDISEKEIRLAAFLRMNLTTKEIAATMNVLPDSILKSKYRLKKKLGLDKTTDLTSFLNTI
jgi:tetratricopeptide (TPR) repeat protein